MISLIFIAILFLVFATGAKRLFGVLTAKTVKSKNEGKFAHNDFLSAFTIESRPSLMDRWEIDLFHRLMSSHRLRCQHF